MDRELYIANVVQQLKDELCATGIQAEIDGRAKHIYSIWRKMQRKGLQFSQIYDVRAVRVLVPEMRDCYTALGIVHTLWRHIPKEFDDYIANPKENGYRSLHTAVIGPEGKVLEVQIRTHAMHEEAELGVCAHWRYKGTDVKSTSSHYEEKISCCARCSSGTRNWATSAAWPISCASTSSPTGSTCSPPTATPSTCPRAPRRWTSPIACTPRSATTAAAPRSTAASCR